MSIDDEDAQDRAWVRAVQTTDDRHAYACLLRRHQGAIRSMLRRLCGGDIGMADDLAQESFLQAYLALAGYRGEARFRTWLYRVAYSVYLQNHRRNSERVQRQTEALDEDRAGWHLSQPSHSSGVALAIDLQRALDQLSEAERLAIAHCHLAELSHAEAAQLWAGHSAPSKLTCCAARRSCAICWPPGHPSHRARGPTMSFEQHDHSVGGDPTDWVDGLLRNEAACPGPADDGFSDRVLRALPAPAPARDTGRLVTYLHFGAMAIGAALLLVLLPQGADLLAEPDGAHGILSMTGLEQVLPALALLAWLCWWSVRQISSDQAAGCPVEEQPADQQGLHPRSAQ